MQIKIGVPSKGRLRKDVLNVFKNNNYNNMLFIVYSN